MGARPDHRFSQLLDRTEELAATALGRGTRLLFVVVAALLIVAAVGSLAGVAGEALPRVLHDRGERDVLDALVQHVLAVAIAAELGLLLVHHDPRAVVEALIFVIARKMVGPEVSATELVAMSAGLALLVGVWWFAARSWPRPRGGGPPAERAGRRAPPGARGGSPADFVAAPPRRRGATGRAGPRGHRRCTAARPCPATCQRMRPPSRSIPRWRTVGPPGTR